MQETYERIVNNFADGVNIDTEKAMHGATATCMTTLVQELRHELQQHAFTQHAQVKILLFALYLMHSSPSNSPPHPWCYYLDCRSRLTCRGRHAGSMGATTSGKSSQTPLIFSLSCRYV